MQFSLKNHAQEFLEYNPRNKAGILLEIIYMLTLCNSPKNVKFNES